MKREAQVNTSLKMVAGFVLLMSTTLVQAQMKSADVAAAKSAFSGNGCANCHDASLQGVGPALKEIAARYKGKKVSAEVAKRIAEGSEGRWGQMAHPPYAGLDSSEAALLARWILAGAP
jgi:cytochrome c